MHIHIHSHTYIHTYNGSETKTSRYPERGSVSPYRCKSLHPTLFSKPKTLNPEALKPRIRTP